MAERDEGPRPKHTFHLPWLEGVDDPTLRKRRIEGVYDGLVAAFMLGWAPILGKFAYHFNVQPMTVAALRTVVAVLFLFGIYLVLWPTLLRIAAFDLLNCFTVGSINGVGALLYYIALARLDAASASLLSTLYAVWVIIFLAAAGQPISRLTLVRLGAALVGAVLVTQPWTIRDPSNYLGAMLMAASAAVNGWYIVMGQWVLADVPSRTATLYILTGMGLTVSAVRFLFGGPLEHFTSPMGWWVIFALGITTAFSRLAMFASIERLGSAQTAIITLMEMAVSLALAFVLLGDRLTLWQWIGALLLVVGGVLARRDVEQGGAPPPAFNPMADGKGGRR